MNNNTLAERLEEGLYQIRSALNHPNIRDDESIRDEVENLRDAIEELDNGIAALIEALTDEPTEDMDGDDESTYY